jgi:hypothetical protein
MAAVVVMQAYRLWTERLKGRDHLEVWIVGRIILKLILKI